MPTIALGGQRRPGHAQHGKSRPNASKPSQIKPGPIATCLTRICLIPVYLQTALLAYTGYFMSPAPMTPGRLIAGFLATSVCILVFVLNALLLTLIGGIVIVLFATTLFTTSPDLMMGVRITQGQWEPYAGVAIVIISFSGLLLLGAYVFTNARQGVRLLGEAYRARAGAHPGL